MFLVLSSFYWHYYSLTSQPLSLWLQLQLQVSFLTDETVEEILVQELPFLVDNISNIFVDCKAIMAPADKPELSSPSRNPSLYTHIRMSSSMQVYYTYDFLIIIRAYRLWETALAFEVVGIILNSFYFTYRLSMTICCLWINRRLLASLNYSAMFEILGIMAV